MSRPTDAERETKQEKSGLGVFKFDQFVQNKTKNTGFLIRTLGAQCNRNELTWVKEFLGQDVSDLCQIDIVAVQDLLSCCKLNTT